jgi:hypothetical protein
MVKLVIAKRKKRRGPMSVGAMWVAAEDGRRLKILTIDASSPSLGDDLLYVFRRNVARHRRQNTAAKRS